MSYFEFWPAWFFYLPVYLYVIYLMIRHRSIMLPTAVNPNLAGGKFVGESKDEILNTVAQFLPEYSVKHCLVRNASEIDDAELLKVVEGQLADKDIQYPLVTKPDLGCRGAGVNLIHDRHDLNTYIQGFPPNEAFICQEFIPYEAEAGVFYCRMPWEKNGKIISLTLKSFPKVIGDGKHTIRELIAMDPRARELTHIYYPRLQSKLDLIPAVSEKISLVFAGNHSKGAIFQDGRDNINQTLTETFDQISKRLPNFYFGRFDIRYQNLSTLEKGLDFKIVEINGASSESTHIWDANYNLKDAYRDLFHQFHLLFIIGEYNQKHGVKTQSIKDFYQSYLLDKKLSKLYPRTH
ncbi:ATP-grasp domain-containing protein [Polynucleobacter sp. JS-Safj-400b-B2]|uniref:ATP-grasp domain-containing protein n=1 Tax=Polynucleobacter sp. JS-Safj-400b-B2 TaxID=2576921 RepID=UPI001C0AD4CA|nr:ATP-grasp domain-containing protein [Polynucleobacter sp. JS-Safj-400b-B2]MBU3626874.1 ATP-grasp domain-containing protein [Polynucleobacter sp. JS-Safj-400b-B2]